MPDNRPGAFREALRYRDQKRVMPTPLGSSELAKLEVAVRERAMFSARTMNVRYLEAISQRVREMLNPRAGTREDGTPVTEGLDRATARLELKQILAEIGYAPEPEDEGTLKDLRSDQRINLVLDTNVQMAQGFGYWKQGQDPDVLEVFPAQELFRAEARKEERPWMQKIWPEAAAKVRDAGAIAAWNKGRMVARKDSPIWIEISDFGQPYPPFKFNSGMDVRDVDREEAVALGVMGENDVVVPQQAAFEMEAA